MLSKFRFWGQIIRNVLLVNFMAICFVECGDSTKSENAVNPPLLSMKQMNDTLELKRGDILVRPNMNLLPGSAFVVNGKNFGHAALVVKGYKHHNIDSLLAGTLIVESIAKDVPAAFQVRECMALTTNCNESFNNHNFDQTYKAQRFRLRLPLKESQVDSIVDFALRQKGKLSSWNASKYFMTEQTQSPTIGGSIENETWYCSLLVWQSFFNVTGLDLDPNGGYMVYPNDLISSTYFDQLPSGQGRVCF